MNLEDIKSKIKTNIKQEHTEFEENMKTVVTFPYHPMTKVIHFYFDIDELFYEARPLPKDDFFGQIISVDKNGNQISDSSLESAVFACEPFEGLDLVWIEDHEDYDYELIDEVMDYARNYYANYLCDLYFQLGGKNLPYHIVFQQTDSSKAFYFQDRTWYEEAELNAKIKNT
ncbi:hypothetical protein H1164_13810 [Thermoactinomyces daqus]|uniref:Uncharacterized protein n=1 Tax=Thermoactinomyces daqus TaxID=1329516 RepID=A0A7W2AJ54_9BACL|nr:hypothetical protein [Thermoactinomyces daqus]MBA4543960.1 hypothetical protein [Thermoactinomyces daqus]